MKEDSANKQLHFLLREHQGMHYSKVKITNVFNGEKATRSDKVFIKIINQERVIHLSLREHKKRFFKKFVIQTVSLRAATVSGFKTECENFYADKLC